MLCVAMRKMTSPGAHLATGLMLAGALLLGASAARAEPVSALPICTQNHYAPQTLDMSQGVNLGQLKKQLAFYACSGAYDSDFNKILSAASAYVARRAAQVSKPAIVLDIDETSLSNMALELVDDFAFINGIPCMLDPASTPDRPKLMGSCGFGNWVALARAPALDGTLALYKVAKQHQVAVFFITGRHESERAATEENLKLAGYEAWDGLTLRRSSDNRTVAQYKSDAREKVAEQGYTIIVNIGDQQSDLDGGYAERAYKLPNPFYFIP